MITTMKREAKRAAIWRGHAMKPWDSPSVDTANCECKFCGAWVHVTVNPAPNEIGIGGSAVAINCTRAKYGTEIR